MSIKLLIIFSLTVQYINAVAWIGASRGGNWPQTHNELVAMTAAHKNDIQLVFLGDSITHRWTAGKGTDVWKKYYSTRHAYNYGIEGDRTENVIYRIENKEFDGIKPKAVVLMIGTNNLGDTSALDIAKGINEIVRQLGTKLPQAKVLLLGVFPRKGAFGLKVHEINKIIAKFEDKKRVFFLDMYNHFETAPGVEIADLYEGDGVHLIAKGYQVWAATMEPLLKKLLA